RRDAQELAGEKTALQLAALLRRVAGAVGSEAARGLLVDALSGHAMHELRRLAALGEADRPQVALDEGGQQARRLAERARPGAELHVEQGRVPECDRPLRARRRVVADDRRLGAEQRARELRRVRD